MESQLNEKVCRLQSCQENKLQLEESVQRLQPQLREMKNTLEKYTKSMTVGLHTHTHTASNTLHSSFLCFSDFKKSFFLLLQSLADQEIRLKVQIKELEANVVAAAPDKAKQKQMEKNLEAFKKGTSPSWTGIRRLQETSRLGQGYVLTALLCSSQTLTWPPAKPGRWRTR